MPDSAQDLETTLLEILKQPDKSHSLTDAIEKVADKEEGKLTDEQRATLAMLLEAGLPSPQEIVRDAELAQHNERIDRTRQADLARRAERRAKRGDHRRKR